MDKFRESSKELPIAPFGEVMWGVVEGTEQPTLVLFNQWFSTQFSVRIGEKLTRCNVIRWAFYEDYNG